MYGRICLLCIALLTFAKPAPLIGSEKYYFVIFGANNGRPKIAHTWATFIKESTFKEDAPKKSPTVKSFTISWLPLSGVVTPRILGSGERGRNFSLEESLKWCEGHEIPIVAWGPVEIKKELFDRAEARKKLLDDGRLGYRMIDWIGRDTSVVNCIHAVSDIVPGPQLVTGLAYGVEASALVAQHLSRYAIRPEISHSHLLPRLGLDKHKVTYRPLERSGATAPVAGK